MDVSRHLISLVLLAFVLATFFSTALTRHRIRHNRNRFKRQNGAHLYLPESYVTDDDSGAPDAGPWTEWGPPSVCSRTCGGGVSTQSRHCQYEGSCQGPSKKHFSCNTQDCPEDEDYRAQQCSEFDRQLFEGVYYQWIPYTKAPNPCELNCMPRGERFYYRHKKHVADGTRCDSEKLDVCVEGKCQPVGCDMMLGSRAREDRCRQCGGNGTTCNTVSGHLDMQDLQVGYNDILLIPAGATNIGIREIAPSNNYLAIRNVSGHYYLNGNWRIDFPKTLKFAGSNFHYERSPQGFSAPDTITCIGPTYEPLFIVLLYQDVNVGVHYEYSIPKAFSSEPGTYTWTFHEFAPCSVSCGGGYQTRNVSCVGRQSLEVVERALCDSTTEPPSTQRCNDQPCEAQWVSGEWSECSEVCGEDGIQTREIRCERIIAAGVSSVVNDQFCIDRYGPKPDATQECNRGGPCPTWFVGPWKPCDHLCGPGKETRQVTCYRKVDGKIEVLEDEQCVVKESKPEEEKQCNLRPCEGVDWVSTEWSGCDKCGLESETRKVHCATQKGEVYSEDLCQGEQKPETVRKCETSKSCDTQWYASQWSECSANCGTGIQTRNVFCGSFEGDTLKRLGDSSCDEKLKYDSIKNCTAETEVCPGEWFSGPWSKCDKDCGAGTRSRKVICMKEEKVIPTSNCDPNAVPFSNEACNTDPCGKDEVLPVDTTKSVEEKEDVITPEPDTDLDLDVESIDEDDECEDGEWEYKDYDELETLEKLVEELSSTSDSSLSTDVTTESSWLTEDLMLSDSTGTEQTAETSDLTAEGSGDFTSPLDTSSTVSGATDSSTESSSLDLTSDEGSGESTIFESTVSGASDKTTEASDASSASTVESTDSSTDSSDTTEQTVDFSSDTTDQTVHSSGSDSTDETPDSTDETPDGTDETTDSTDETPDSTNQTSDTTDSSDTTDDSSTDVTESTINSSDTTDQITDSSTDNTSEDTSPSTITTETVTTEDSSSDTTAVSSSDSTTEIISTTDLDSTTDSSDLTTLESTTLEEDIQILEYDFKQDVSSTETIDGSTTEDVVSSTSSDGSTESVSEYTTVSRMSSEASSEESTVSGMTTESEISTDESSTIETSTSSELSTESDMTTESGGTSESGASTESEPTTESGSTSEPGSTSESGSSSETEGTSESGPTTESGPTESTYSTESEMTESTLIDIWSTTESDLTSVTWDTTPYTIESVTRKRVKVCKRRKPSCKTTPFGCCYDLVTPAQGPFDKGCPTPKTCNDTKYGCCIDGVSPAKGPKQKGCPESQCDQTLFGCCPDSKTPAKGNDFEGCKKEPPPPACLSSEFGCCEDNITTATGPDGKGCKECEKTQFGCCPDGVQAATGKNNEGCEPEIKTEPSVEEDCTNSAFGCCPDGQTTATGEHFDGCDIINKENCTQSYFGCCPDGVSAALGPEGKGCKSSCEDSEHGCCPDKITPAHGPSQEGCCLVHPYGCCPDNILPARGSNLEGCGCQYSPYGCCPDNQTAARGYGNEGCGCQHTEHGCCPDRYTPAAGPEYQGCACHTYQFGCCPDGISEAKGPHKQGCGCRNTEFGCCSDDQTPAQGPDFAGCDCSSSKHGCCPDGVTDAKGDNFEECENVPDNRQENCLLEKDRGSCRNYTVKWFFDMQYGGCSRFWYGGCDGNSNRFASMEECKNICVEPQGKEICQLPKVTGACEGYFPSWYYDKDRKQCGQFIWGGCLGNANRFETREECQSLCAVDHDQDACEQPKEEGPCSGSYRRWYFNKETNSCDLFAYGGCKANNNNFPTDLACKQQCLEPGRKKDLCTLPREQGDCTGREPRWYFDQSENRCMPFYYSGCGGNSNQFTSREACETDCPTEIEKDTCTLAAQIGECHNYTDRWYYDTKEKRCRQFYYGGCGGNGNNFRTEPECQQRCEQEQIVATEPAPQEQFKTEFCFLPSASGSCRGSNVRWFYDSREGVCKQFIYGGCDGNGNNFATRDDCYQRCNHVQDLCSLPMVVGPCSTDYLQWFYDKSTDTCQEFNYGGCQGNDNRFNDQESCERRCKKSATERRTEVAFVVSTEAPRFDRATQSPEIQICYSPVNVGDCSDSKAAWYYDAANQRCQAFVYTGCGGNANRFVSEEHCERHCGRLRGLDVCSHPKDSGSCEGEISKYFFDRTAGRCHEFTYTGCGGSGNRFSSVEECESVCVKLAEPETQNVTTISRTAICRLPLEVGPCEGHYHQLRWHYDEERAYCVSFIYSGCGGNFNNFKTYQQCVDYCHQQQQPPGAHNEIPDESQSKDSCETYREECTSLLCPYGTEGYVDADNCNRCRCYEPCRDTICPEQTVCVIDLNPNASLPQQTQFIAICRSIIKDGECPQLSSSRDCSYECRQDSDCSGDLKCCSTGCGYACVVPAEYFTTYLPAFTDAPTYARGHPPVIIDELSNTNVSAEEGSYISLKCDAQGNPQPTITWRKGNAIVDESSTRHRMMADGSLQIVGLIRSDAGTYHCIADNGVGHPARKDIDLDVTEPTPHPANVIGDDDTKLTVTFGAPTTIRCYAYGWPRPSVTWWRGDSMLPLSSSVYKQRRDHSLLIHSVRLSNLGIYTCQAYNGLGKAASWSLTVQAIGPVYSEDPEDDKFREFLISVADKPVPTTSRPEWPYRPQRPVTPRPRPVPTPEPHIPSPYTEPSPEIIPDNNIVPEQPRVYTVPVRTNITMTQMKFPVGSDISIPCDVDGYPVPQVQWYRNNGDPLNQSESIQISESHRLTIIRANTSDSGEYVCKAENHYSVSSSSVNILVEGIYIHQNCTDNPFFANCSLIVQAKFCTHKYYARFCCRSCTQAGQLPSYGPHLTDARQSPARS